MAVLTDIIYISWLCSWESQTQMDQMEGMKTGESRDKSDARPCSKSAILVNKSFVCSFNISEFVFIVAVFINKNNKTMNHNAFVLKERKDLIQRK